MNLLNRLCSILTIFSVFAAGSGCAKEPVSSGVYSCTVVPAENIDDASIDPYLKTYANDLYWTPLEAWKTRFDLDAASKTTLTFSISRKADAAPYGIEDCGGGNGIYVSVEVTLRTEDEQIDKTIPATMIVTDDQPRLVGSPEYPAEDLDLNIRLRNGAATGDISTGYKLDEDGAPTSKGGLFGGLNNPCGGVAQLPQAEVLFPVSPRAAYAALDGDRATLDWGQGRSLSVVLQATACSATTCYSSNDPEADITNGVFTLDLALLSPEGDTLLRAEGNEAYISTFDFNYSGMGDDASINGDRRGNLTFFLAYVAGGALEVISPDAIFEPFVSNSDVQDVFIDSLNYRLVFENGQYQEGELEMNVSTWNKNAELDDNKNPVGRENFGKGAIVVTSP